MIQSEPFLLKKNFTAYFSDQLVKLEAHVSILKERVGVDGN